MPLILPDQLPAVELLKQENIFTMGYKRADSQQIRPLRLAILNLMPIKITTETDFVRILSNSALQVQIDFMKIKSHTSKNTPIEHMKMFYRNFEDMKKEKYDGLIVTGAPLEFMDYEEVTYWDELQDVFNWAHHNVTSTIYVCWAAFAALYHFYGIPKYNTDSKIFGVFSHRMLAPELPIFRGFDDEFFAHDSVKLHNSQTSCVELLNPDGSVAVKLNYKCPVIAFWSPYQKNAPFVCLEPWYGVGDPRGFEGEFKEKPLINHLMPGASFMSEYIISIGE